MTKSQEQRMNELAEEHYKKTDHVPTEWAVMNFKAGYQAAMKEAEVLVEALEEAINLLQVAEHKQDDKWYNRESVVIKTLKKFKG